ncbi:MAG: hypothetical protein R6X34_12105 [Chloroflexota bacterium]
MKKFLLLVLLGVCILAWVGHAETQDRKEWLKQNSPARPVVKQDFVQPEPVQSTPEKDVVTGILETAAGETAKRSSFSSVTAPAWTQAEQRKDSDKADIQLVPKASFVNGDRPANDGRTIPTAVPQKARDK